jgi:hypothetical protein
LAEPEPRHRVFYWNGALAVACCLVTLVLAVCMPRYEDSAVVFLMYGSLFGQIAVAAGWTAFGPGHFIVRWPLAMLWTTILIAIPSLPMIPQGEYGVAYIYGAWLGGQYLLSALSLGGIALGCGLRLRFHNQFRAEWKGEGQFGIRQLLIFTAIVAVMLAIGRILFRLEFPEVDRGIWSIIAFMIAAEVLLTVPLLTVIFRERSAAIATVLCVLVMAAATPLETHLFTAVAGSAARVSSLKFGLANLTSTLVILMFGITARRSGYHFGRQRMLESQVASPPDAR